LLVSVGILCYINENRRIKDKITLTKFITNEIIFKIVDVVLEYVMGLRRYKAVNDR